MYLETNWEIPSESGAGSESGFGSPASEVPASEVQFP